MGILTGSQKSEPMHYGEVFGVWDHLFRAQGCLGKFQLLMNHTGDKDLKKFIENLIEEVVTPETNNLEKLLRENGVPYQAQLVKYGGKLLQLIKQKGWLVVPPLHTELAK